MEIMKEPKPNKKSDKMPNGIYYRLLTEIAPRIYTTLLARKFEEIDKLHDDIGAEVVISVEWLAIEAVRHAKALINEIYENRFNN